MRERVFERVNQRHGAEGLFRSAIVAAVLVGGGAAIGVAATRGGNESTPAPAAGGALRSIPIEHSPTWIVELNGRPLTAAQERRLVDYANGMWGTDFGTLDALAPRVQEPTAAVRNLVEGALIGVEPIVPLVVEIPGTTDRVTVSDAQVSVLREVYGLTNGEITLVIRLASVTTERVRLPNEEPAWQPVVALLAATGQIQQLQEAESARRRDSRLREVVASMPAGWSATEEMSRALDARRGDAADRARWRRAAELLPAGWPATEVMLRAGGEPTSAEVSIADLQRRYDEGLDLYDHHPSLASLHALDPSLAARIVASGGDPEQVSDEDSERGLALLRRGGLVSTGSAPFEQIGGTSDGGVLSSLSSFFESTPERD